MSERKSKGTILQVLQSYVEKRFGRDAWQRVLSAMSPSDRQCVESAVAIGWYPTSVVMNAFMAFEAVLGPREPQLLADFGRHGAEQDLTVFHRMFLRMANPAFVVEKTGEYWHRFHTHGTMTSRRVDHGSITTLSDFQSSPVYCAMLAPYAARLFELVGAKRVHVAHAECIHRGDNTCVFVSRWS